MDGQTDIETDFIRSTQRRLSRPKNADNMLIIYWWPLSCNWNKKYFGKPALKKMIQKQLIEVDSTGMDYH